MKKIICFAIAVFTLSIFAAFPQTKIQDTSSEMVINNGPIDFIDPSRITKPSEHRIYLALFEGLVSYEPKTCRPIPALAKKWEISGKNNEIITFHLRKTTWSDGTPITAQTVVDSWLYYLFPQTAAEYSYLPAEIIKGAKEFNEGKASYDSVGLRALDELTLEVTLVGMVPFAESMMAHFSFPVLPMHAIEKYGDNWTKPENFVGNGPCVLESCNISKKITVVPNKRYWNRKNVFISRITFLTNETCEDAFTAFKKGSIDWNTDVPNERNEIKQLKEFHSNPQLATYYYTFNTNDPVLKDVRVRKALAKAIDKEKLSEYIFYAIPTDSFVPPIGNYETASGNGFDVKEARDLLAKAGYPDGNGFPKITVIYNTNSQHEFIAEFIQQQWKENLGIEVVLKNLEWNTFLTRRMNGDFQIARAGWVGDYADPSNFLELCASYSGNNDGRYSNQAFDRLLLRASRMSSGAKRNAVLNQAEEILITQDQALLPLYWYSYTNLIDLDKWQGWYTNILDIHPYVGLKPVTPTNRPK